MTANVAGRYWVVKVVVRVCAWYFVFVLDNCTLSVVRGPLFGDTELLTTDN